MGSVILQPTLEDGVAHEVDATRDVELSHCVGFVNLDGLDTQRKAGGDLFVAVAERDETQDFRLAISQAGFRLSPGSAVAIVAHDFGAELRIYVFPTCGHRADSMDQFVWRALLQHVGAGSRPE